MTRREILTLALAPQQVHYRTYSRALPDYLTRLAREAYTRRQRALDALTTPQAIKSRQAWARETFWALTGGQPPRTPLNLRSVGEFRRDGYRVEKLTYESQPGFIGVHSCSLVADFSFSWKLWKRCGKKLLQTRGPHASKQPG